MTALPRYVDLNADVGEGMGDDAQLIPLVTSVNIACGGHAGDAATMARAVERAAQADVAVGAHPGLEDRAEFGRVGRPLAPAQARELVCRQVAALSAIAERLRVRVRHLKLHGALYHMAARDGALAAAIVDAAAELDAALILVGPPGSALLAAASARGLATAAEVFADRRYRSDGSLVPRGAPMALIADPAEAIAQVVGMVLHGTVRSIDGTNVAVRADTVCLHGDGPDAVGFAQALRTALAGQEIVLRPVHG
jgi:UPF0271 protein